jgi:hypothetical protein
MITSPLFSPETYESTFGTYVFLRSAVLRRVASRGVTNARERSQPGRTARTTRSYGKRGAGRLVIFRTSRDAIRGLLPALLLRRGEIDLPELHLLIELLDTSSLYEGTLVIDVLGLDALVVALLAHHAHEVKPLRTAGETTDKGRRAFILAATYLYAYCVLHGGDCSTGPSGKARETRCPRGTARIGYFAYDWSIFQMPVRKRFRVIRPPNWSSLGRIVLSKNSKSEGFPGTS